MTSQRFLLSFLQFLIGIVVLVTNLDAAPIIQDKSVAAAVRLHVQTNVTVQNMEWLQRFGYLVPPNPRTGALMHENSIASSIQELQRFAGLPETGTMDLETVKLMKRDRCGVPDFGPMDNTKRRRRRFTLHGTFWNKNHLTWRVTNSNNDGLSNYLVESILEAAFNKWAAVTNLRFSKISSGEADIMIGFYRGYHHDAYPFDGRDSVLAHAFYPHDNKGQSGDVHFDDDEEFTHKSTKGRSLLVVAVHELGHSLGLQHSNVRDSIMYPWYQSFGGNDFDLKIDDVVGIQKLYGTPLVTTKTPLTTNQTATITTTKTPPVVCASHVKAVFLSSDGRTFVINKEKVYILRKRILGIEKGPVLVSKLFEGVSYVDAAYTSSNGKTYLFSGDMVHIFKNQKKEGKMSISSKYYGMPKGIKKIDAALEWPYNGRAYLFSGEYYWRFDSGKGKIDRGYPRKIVDAWGGIPANIEAGFTWTNGVTYFFKGEEYYRLKKTLPVEVENGYPKNIEKNWMRCREDLKGASRGTGIQIVASFSLWILTTLLSISLF